MKTFTDSRGDVWVLTLDILQAKRVRDRVGIDLVSDAASALGRLGADVIAMVDVLAVLTSSQRSERGVSDEDFARRLDADTIEAAITALEDVVVGFIPPRRRGVIQGLLERARTVQQRRIEAAMATLADGTADAEVERALTMAGDWSTNSPVSSASTPAP